MRMPIARQWDWDVASIMISEQALIEVGNRKVHPFKAVVLNHPMLSPVNTVPHAVVIPNHKIILVLLHNSNFATVISHSVNI